MVNISHVTIVTTQMCLHSEYLYNDSNLQCTTHFKGNPYKCKELYYKSLCFATFSCPPTKFPDPTIHVLEFTRGTHHNGTGAPPLTCGHKGRV